MVEQDTIRLLRECDAGVRMGIASIEDVEKHAKGEDMKKILSDCKEAHAALAKDLEKALSRFGDEGKNPNPIAKGMSWMKNGAEARDVREGFHDRGSYGGWLQYGHQVALALPQ